MTHRRQLLLPLLITRGYAQNYARTPYDDDDDGGDTTRKMSRNFVFAEEGRRAYTKRQRRRHDQRATQRHTRTHAPSNKPKKKQQKPAPDACDASAHAFQHSRICFPYGLSSVCARWISRVRALDFDAHLPRMLCCLAHARARVHFVGCYEFMAPVPMRLQPKYSATICAAAFRLDMCLVHVV